ncbi:MAG: Unknown protein [uncultured Sulfurovum sp.]|uniref:Uncharacterized protein n=1 Tax=uncultured Sulfurovum sp. TaxID=269237 RepID=A0A6S6S611_9BACT|nr:MAG: Unknown protein [uncultured Sulfurovum sp.]
MLNNNFFKLGTVAVLLTSTLLGAGTAKCVGGVCFVNLDKLKPSKGFEKSEENLVVLEQPRYIEEVNTNTQNNFIDKSITIVLDGETITVFPHSSYVMNDLEVIYSDDNVNENELLVTGESDRIEDIILEKSGLPNSEFFCEKNKKPLYDSTEDTFQCV